ncbi:hypothetical protein DFA_10754 [Cavenderia fasciculata]|uniref:Uncharacterized protein n=1 Tax=Cavenderia fasciculata TaxID=261658 RepID=F4QBA9_CACFS|nr:uncharacterized protein DFA_10754 [Cavenderia fasciculata]EGG14881.1 hypothetical protein DFA_10754 [Cavenderia fasciculata]|eukprot:XP_004351397.1 hypothetical protein DFA_10754 [Cavenderia fasciculata]
MTDNLTDDINEEDQDSIEFFISFSGHGFEPSVLNNAGRLLVLNIFANYRNSTLQNLHHHGQNLQVSNPPFFGPGTRVDNERHFHYASPTGLFIVLSFFQFNRKCESSSIDSTRQFI